MANKIPLFLLIPSSKETTPRGSGKMRLSFLEKGIHHFARVVKEGYIQWECSSRNGFFQKIDARVKILFLLSFILMVSLKKDMVSEVGISIFVFMLVLLSRLNLLQVYKKVLLLGFLFGFLVALPSAFNVITSGEIILPIVNLSRPYQLWIYHLPQEIGITRQGAYGVAMLTLRVMNSLSLSLLILYTTPFHEIIRALKVLKIPNSFLMVIMLCYRYLFILAKTVGEMHLAKKSRVMREITSTEARGWVVGRVAFMFRKTRLRCEEVFKAMLARGFSDSLQFYGFPAMQKADWAVASLFFCLGIFFLWI